MIAVVLIAHFAYVKDMSKQSGVCLAVHVCIHIATSEVSPSSMRNVEGLIYDASSISPHYSLCLFVSVQQMYSSLCRMFNERLA